MITRAIPRFLLISVAVGVVVTAVMLSLFWLQYRSLARDLVETGAAEHARLLEANFERRSRLDLEATAEALAATLELEAAEAGAIRGALYGALAGNGSMVGLEFSSDGQTITAGDVADAEPGDEAVWLPGRLVIAQAVGDAGRLEGTFDLALLEQNAAAYAGLLARTEAASRRMSFFWVGSGALVMLLLSGAAIWITARSRAGRIRALKSEAEKLRDADFGERLPASGNDELAELAAMFNEMRDRLKATTISRDYVDGILSSMNDAVIVTDHHGTIRRINPATTQMLGYEQDELVGRSVESFVISRKSAALLSGEPSGLPRETTFVSKFGESVPVSYTCSVLGGAGGDAGDRVYAAQNISERRRAEQRIRYLARIDALTKIPNRMQFQHLLQRAIARARRNGRPLALFYLDIDRFKDINDTFGHLAGDTTLETVAERLSAALPERSVIGRLAGDEFAVIVEGLKKGGTPRDETDRLARLLLARLADPLFVQGHEVFMTASLGVAFYPSDAANVIDLIRNADAALYHAKKAGGNVFSYYEPEMNEAAVERLMTKSRLKRSFERDELLVHYQPKYNLENGQVFGAEALVRWELPERGVILPSDFIPIAEETDLIIEIGEWVLDKVCEDFRRWQRSVSSAGRVSINLSLKQLRQPNFANRITSILRSYEVSPTSLELEITETTLMENPERTVKLLDQLYGLGLHLAIDDFGTGYSSLSALQQFPISTLKIDQSFVRDVANNPDDATIVSTIVQMGRNLNMDVVAEGVESEEQLVFLQQLGCTYAQGLLFGDPMSADDYLELLFAQAEGTDRHRALFA